MPKSEGLGLRHLKTKVYFVRGDTDEFKLTLRIFLTPQFSVNHPLYAITVIFTYLLNDKASNAEFFQIFLCELYHT